MIMAYEKHGHTGDSGAYMSRTYLSWVAMKQRCTNQNHSAFARYGGRGITVCDRWADSFKKFLVDMGERPTGKSLDRINNNKGYVKSNCKWATRAEQQNNMRNNVYVICDNGEMPASKVAKKLDMNIGRVYKLAEIGFTFEQIKIRNTTKPTLSTRRDIFPAIAVKKEAEKLFTERNDQIKYMVDIGCVMDDVGDVFGITRQTIHHIIKNVV